MGLDAEKTLKDSAKIVGELSGEDIERAVPGLVETVVEEKGERVVSVEMG